MKTLSALVLGALALTSSGALANERHFAWTYESATLPQGARELELWTTPRLERDMYYRRFDQRAELEWGVLDRLQTSVYFNFSLQKTDPDAVTAFAWGVSNEWKLKLLDAVADPIGLSVYGELSAALGDVELEGKLIADKQLGPVLVALNATVEHEWGFGAGGVQREIKAEGDLGASYLLRLGGSTQLGLGAELRSESLFSGSEGYETTTFFAGPMVSFATQGFWTVLSFQPQLGSHKAEAFEMSYPGRLELHDHERFNVRLLAGIHL